MPRIPSQDDHVLPRPVTRLPEYAKIDARKNAAAKLVECFGLSPQAAQAFADAAVDPTALRRAADIPEEIAVPGGVLRAIRGRIWSRLAMPDPRNPRVGPTRRHAFAVEPGTSDDCRFRPVGQSLGLPGRPELAVDIESREHLTWASLQAKSYILNRNDWRASIRSQGVMTEVWVAATHYRHADGTPDLVALTTVEGSSRATAVHDILEERSVDLMYAHNTSTPPARIALRSANKAFDDQGASDPAVAISLRCETMPALFLLGFVPHAEGNEDFHTAVRSLVALRHVEPPEPWGEGPQHEALADGILEELERQGLVTSLERQWMAGALTKSEAVAAHLSDDPTVRAAAIIRHFTTTNGPSHAIRRAVTGQSTKSRINRQLIHAVAAALIMRSVPVQGPAAERIRKYLADAIPGTLHGAPWLATTRAPEVLVAEALSELGVDANGGAASAELSARALYALVTTLRLHADKGTANNEQVDRRKPAEVIDVMRKTIRGIHQLGRALEDFASKTPIRMVDADGQVLFSSDGSTAREINDNVLRTVWPKDGAPSHVPSPTTPQELLQNALSAFGAAITDLDVAYQAVIKVKGNAGEALVEIEGAAPAHCKEWRRTLNDIVDELAVWASNSKRRYGAGGHPMVSVADSSAQQQQDDEADNPPGEIGSLV